MGTGNGCSMALSRHKAPPPCRQACELPLAICSQDAAVTQRFTHSLFHGERAKASALSLLLFLRLCVFGGRSCWVLQVKSVGATCAQHLRKLPAALLIISLCAHRSTCFLCHTAGYPAPWTRSAKVRDRWFQILTFSKWFKPSYESSAGSVSSLTTSVVSQSYFCVSPARLLLCKGSQIQIFCQTWQKINRKKTLPLLSPLYGVAAIFNDQR